jgi:hypothetical protein
MKNGTGNCMTEYSLNKIKNVLDEPFVVIFFGAINSEKYREYLKLGDDREVSKIIYKNEEVKWSSSRIRQIRNFFDLENNNDAVLLSYNGKDELYITKPYGKVFDLPEDYRTQYDRDCEEKDMKEGKIFRNGKIYHLPKLIRVKVLKELQIENVPHGLATFPSNQYYNRGTIRKISEKYDQVKEFIKFYLGETLKLPTKFSKVLDYLSPVEFETYIFQILQNAGLFVPAWRGSTLKGVDLLAYNFTNDTLSIPPIELSPGQDIKVQVKRIKRIYSYEEDFFTVYLGKSNYEKNLLGVDWIHDSTLRQPKTLSWLSNTFHWMKKEDQEQIRKLIQTPNNF